MKGGLWGIGRMGKMITNSMDFFQGKLLAVFQNDDPEILGLAAWAMGEVGFKPSLSYLDNLRERNEPVRIYIDGDFNEKPLGQWAEEAVNKITKSA
jgi:hypothetical protein